MAVVAQVRVIADAVCELPFQAKRDVIFLQRRKPLAVAVADEAVGYANALG